MPKINPLLRAAIEIALVVLVVFLLVSNCNTVRDKNALVKSIAEIGVNKQQPFTVEKRKDSSVAATQTEISLSAEDAKKLGMVVGLSDDLKNIKSQLKVVTNTIIDTAWASFSIPENYADTTGMEDSIKRKYLSTIKVPAPFSVKKKWYSINGVVEKTGVSFDSIVIPNQSDIVYGYKKQGFLKPSVAVVRIVNTNPYIKFTGISNLTIKPKKNWYDSKILWFGLGFGSELFLSKKL